MQFRLKYLIILLFSISTVARAEFIELKHADKLEYYKDSGRSVVRAVGNVTITYRDTEIRADQIITFQESKDVIAIGHVVHYEYYTEEEIATKGLEGLRVYPKDEKERKALKTKPRIPRVTTYAEKFVYNMKSRLGVIKNAQIFTETAYITGREIKKTGPDTFEAVEGSYTTCKECIQKDEPPEWQFRAAHLVATRESYARMTNATFHILDMPVFYFPWFIYPTKRERQTGLLPPDFLSTLSNNEASMGLGTRFFWAISRSYDSTYYYSIVPKHGHKHGLEFRYHPVTNAKGDMRVFFINDGSEKYATVNRETHERRWAGSLNHTQDFSDNFRFRARGAYLSDQYYLSHLGNDVPYYGWKALVSSAVFVYNSEDTMTSLENAYYYHMSALDQDDSVHKVPEINFFSTTQPLFEGSPFYLSFDSTYTHFYKGSNRLKNVNDAANLGLSDDVGNDNIADSNDPDGSEGNGLVDSVESKKGHRVMLIPSLYWPINIMGKFYLKPSISHSTLVYRPDVQSKTTREIPYKNVWNVNVDFSTSVEKIFTINGNAYKHKIYPELRYIYQFGEKKIGAHPLFDSFDETGKKQKVAFILDNLLIEENGYKELFQLTLEQQVNIEYWFRRSTAKNESEELEAEQEAEINNVLDPFKVVMKLNFTQIPSFLRSVTGRSELYYDHYINDVNRISSQLNFADVRGDTLSFGYNLESISAESEDNTNYLISGLKLVINQNYSITYQNEYSFIEDKRYKETIAFDVLPDSKCWKLNLKYQTIAGGEKEIKFNWIVEPNWGII